MKQRAPENGNRPREKHFPMPHLPGHASNRRHSRRAGCFYASRHVFGGPGEKTRTESGCITVTPLETETRTPKGFTLPRFSVCKVDVRSPLSTPPYPTRSGNTRELASIVNKRVAGPVNLEAVIRRCVPALAVAPVRDAGPIDAPSGPPYCAPPRRVSEISRP